MNDKVVYAELILQVGSLIFMESKSSSFLFGKPLYYWKFRDSTIYYGPFNSLYEAGDNVDQVMRSGQPDITASAPVATDVITEIPMNVIKVDFKAKRRIK